MLKRVLDPKHYPLEHDRHPIYNMIYKEELMQFTVPRTVDSFILDTEAPLSGTKEEMDRYLAKYTDEVDEQFEVI